MPQPRYEPVGSSTTTPIENKQRKEIVLKRPVVNCELLYHYGDLDCTPVRDVSYRATLADGSQRTGMLDGNGKALLAGIPVGPVKVEYQYDQTDEDDPAIVAAREEVRKALDAIVAQTKADMAEEWKQWNEAGWIKRYTLKLGNHYRGQAVGAWDWLKGTVETVWQLAVLLYKTDKEIRELRTMILLGQWDALDQRIAQYRQKGEKVVDAASEVKELLILIFHDAKTRQLIMDFPSQWWAAIPPDEQEELKARYGTQIAIDIVIAVLLAAFTAGTAGAAYGGAKWTANIGRLGAKVVKLLDALKDSFQKLAKALKLRKRRIVDVKKPDPQRRIETEWKPKEEPKPKPTGAPGEEYAVVNGKKVYPKTHGKLFHGTDKATLGYAESTPLKTIAKDIYEKGLPARGSNVDLAEHAKGANDRAFRGTTTMLQSPDRQAGAVLWADEGGLVVELKNVKGYDVNELLEGRVKKPDGTFGGNSMHGEQEVAVPGAIKPEQVEMVYEVYTNSRGQLRHRKIPR